MKMEMPEQNGFNGVKQKMFLGSEAILKFFLGTSDEIDTLIKCRGSEVELATFDYNLYEALGSLKPDDEFKLNKLINLLEVVDIVSYKLNRHMEKPILKDERVDEIRAIALKKL